jgi:hypothetical protein
MLSSRISSFTVTCNQCNQKSTYLIDGNIFSRKRNFFSKILKFFLKIENKGKKSSEEIELRKSEFEKTEEVNLGKFDLGKKEKIEESPSSNRLPPKWLTPIASNTDSSNPSRFARGKNKDENN